MTQFENPVEHVLKDKGPYGLSLKEIEYLLGVDRRRIMYHIKDSYYIEDTDPWLHGSMKQKIRVFRYNPQKCKYGLRKIKSRNPVPSQVLESD